MKVPRFRRRSDPAHTDWVPANHYTLKEKLFPMTVAYSLITRDRPGVLRDVAGAVASAGGNIAYTQQHVLERGAHAGSALIYMEVEGVEGDGPVEELRDLDAVREVDVVPSFEKVYGRRVIVIGGGAQVAEVAAGAISEADRHNLRGERISVDTIPLVGEENIHEAATAVERLHRAGVLVLAGALMGGKVTEAVKEVKREGIPVISLKNVGSAQEHSDLVVNDPTQAGVIAAMAVSDAAEFDIERVKGRTI